MAKAVKEVKNEYKAKNVFFLFSARALCRGLPDEADYFGFKEQFAALKAEFEAQLIEEAELNKAIAENLERITL